MSLFLIVFAAITELGSVFSWYIIQTVFLSEYPKIAHGSLLFFILMPVVAIISFGLSWNHYSKTNSIAYSVSAWWLGFLLYIFLASIIVGLLYSIWVYIGISNNLSTVIGILVYICAFAMTVYGTIHSYQTEITKYSLPKENFPISWHGRKIVIISDTHIGQVNGVGFLQKTIEKVNAVNPDIVFIAGDLIDGPKIPLEWLGELKNIQAPLGTYFTSGNHETYSRDFEAVIHTLENTVTVLEDTTRLIDGVQIGGISYKHETVDVTRETLRRFGLDKTKPSIVMLHDPKNISALIDEDITLSISGHTHGGQLFPGTLIVKKIYGVFAYGLNKNKKTYSITTSGVGTAQAPVRIGTKSEIVLLEIN